MTITASRATTSPATWRTRTAFGWIFLTSLVIALVAPLPYLTTSLADVAREQSDLPIAVAGLAGLTLAPFNLAGTVGVLGFGTLAGCWLAFAATAFRTIRRGDIAKHRRWAVRAFALTYAAVTLRLWVAVLVSTQVGLFDVGEPVAFSRAYLVVPFLAWVPNLIVAEIYLRAAQRGV